MTDRIDPIAAAIDHIRRITPSNDSWTAKDIAYEPQDPDEVDDSIATILNAVVAGRLIPADALEAERARAEKAEAERDAWIETARLHSKAEAAFLNWLRSAGEHMRAFGVTICDDGSDAGEVLVAKVPECAKAMAGRITDLEAERDCDFVVIRDLLALTRRLLDAVDAQGAENERLRESLTRIREASKFWAGDVTCSDAVRYAHESTYRMARAALSGEGEP